MRTGLLIGAAVAIVLGVIAWMRSAPPPGSGHHGAPAGVSHESLGQYTQLSPEAQALADKIDDPEHWAFVVYSMSPAGSAHDGDEGRLAPYLKVLGQCRTTVTQTEAEDRSISREVSRVVISLNAVADAWIHSGPLGALRPRLLHLGSRCGNHPDVFVQSALALMLLAIKDKPGAEPFPPESQRLLDQLMKNDYVRSQATQRFEAWAALAKQDHPGG
ncbi:MAG: hypothetical protein IT437_09210 [Phycisphaerales bacterium]|nr:hypothetical protein [Phycisphaerales bacterium]